MTTTVVNTNQRRAVLEALRAAGGRIEDPSGRATRVLADAIGYGKTMTSLIGVLKGMEQLGLIERDILGKRTRSITLKGYTPPEPGPLDVPAVEPEQRAPAVTQTSAQAVAAELLEQIVTRLSEPDSDELKRRLAATLDDNVRLRRRARDLEDDVRSLTAERDGLRQQRRKLEANIAALLDEGKRVVNDETRRALARLMQERPANGKG